MVSRDLKMMKEWCRMINDNASSTSLPIPVILSLDIDVALSSFGN